MSYFFEQNFNFLYFSKDFQREREEKSTRKLLRLGNTNNYLLMSYDQVLRYITAITFLIIHKTFPLNICLLLMIAKVWKMTLHMLGTTFISAFDEVDLFSPPSSLRYQEGHFFSFSMDQCSPYLAYSFFNLPAIISSPQRATPALYRSFLRHSFTFLNPFPMHSYLVVCFRKYCSMFQMMEIQYYGYLTLFGKMLRWKKCEKSRKVFSLIAKFLWRNMQT